MEQLVKKIVNLGIGAGKLVEENAQKVMEDIGTTLNTLIAKGETADDETSLKIKKAIEDTTVNVSQIVGNSTKGATEIFEKVKTSLDGLVTQVKGFVEKK